MSTRDSFVEYPPAHALVPLTRDAVEHMVGCAVSTFPGRYLEAFTHKSASRETRVDSLERLEFLGDSVISFVVAKYLFDTYPREDEGFLSRIRTKLTCSATLASLGRAIGLHNYVIMNGMSMAFKWNTNDATVEDVLEALVGAVYLDRGLCMAKSFFLGLIETHVDKKDLLENNNYKDLLLRWARQHDVPAPTYESTRVPSAARDGTTVYDTFVTVGSIKGRSVDVIKKKSEMKAARMALLELKVIGGSSEKDRY